MRATARDALRLALGTFTIVRVRPPQDVSLRVARAAMALAPLVGLALGLAAAGVLLGLRELAAPPLLAAALVVAGLALLTRALHLDGLADTADGLGSGHVGDGALTVMRRSDIGPFGVLTLVLVLLVDVTAIASGPARLVVLAVVTGRAAVVLSCRRGVDAARREGLGAAVAGSVPAWLAAVLVVLMVGLGAALLSWQGALAAATGLLVAEALIRRASSRFGGITGDVIGAAVESATAVTLVSWVLLTSHAS